MQSAETIELTLSTSAGPVSLGTRKTITITIVDDDSPGALEVAAGDTRLDLS